MLTFTTQCSGDLGLEVLGRVVAQAFIHFPVGTPAPVPAPVLHVYDLWRGGPHKVLPIDKALNEMLRIGEEYQRISIP